MYGVTHVYTSYVACRFGSGHWDMGERRMGSRNMGATQGQEKTGRQVASSFVQYPVLGQSPRTEAEERAKKGYRRRGIG